MSNIYVGMDVHQDSITLAVLSAHASEATRVDRLPTDLPKLHHYLARLAAEADLQVQAGERSRRPRSASLFVPHRRIIAKPLCLRPRDARLDHSRGVPSRPTTRHRLMVHREFHRSEHIGWLRAAVLGANDGLISTSSLVVGVAAAQTGREPVLLAALAGLVAGALSMAAGEYVSVSSQSDTEQADLARERKELATSPALERAELAGIYVNRGLTPDLAGQVADQLMAKDALGAHARDELGLSEVTQARPIQAAMASAAAFAAGAAPPLLIVVVHPLANLTPVVIGASLVILVFLGALAARLGGAPMTRGAIRVVFWGAVAMAATALVGRFFGAVA